jgi:uncharacterized RDD family membrane protein YckC
MLHESDLPQDNPVPQAVHKVVYEPIFTFPPIAGFWRRFFAWVIDSLILGVIGQVIGFLFSSFLFSLGPYGRPIGLLFIIPYFGVLNSKIGGGQTLGKRLLNIAVRNKDNEPIGVGRSIIRISLLAFPALFNGWAVPIFQNYVVTWFLALLIYGLGGAILYTMVFNRKTRQGLHDLLLGTYVVHLDGRSIEAFPTSARIHWTVTWFWIGFVAISSLVMLLIAPTLIAKSPLASAMSIYHVLQDDPRFFGVGVNDNTVLSSNGKTSHALIITAWCKGSLEGDEKKAVVASLVKTVLDTTQNINDYDGIQIKLTSSYDIGIASWSSSMSFSDSIASWRKQIYPNGTPIGFVPSLIAHMPAIL